MKRDWPALGLLASALALAACGDRADPAGNPADTAMKPAPDDAPAVARAAPPDGEVTVRSNGETLTAKRSSLAADVSDLHARIVGPNLVINLPADVLFAFDKAELRPDAIGALRKSADAIRSAPEGAVTVVGHTDNKGSDGYNDDLSRRRAQAVRDWLGEQVGVRQRDLSVQGKGEREPVAPNANPDGSDDPDGRARNRRVEIVIPR